MASLYTQKQDHRQKTESREISPSSLLTSLHCGEENWKFLDLEFDEINSNTHKLLSPNLIENTENDETVLISLFLKEKQQNERFEICSLNSRCETVKWILKVNSHFGFSNLTSILAINYFDRFCYLCFEKVDKRKQKQESWLIKLVAVTCVSLAAKVEEIYVPLLVDLQVEEIEYKFEAKTIQRMELMILSTLEWKMNPVTPFSFFDHIITMLGLKSHLGSDFRDQCQLLFLSVVSDSRILHYLPSVLAIATIFHIINQIELLNDPINYQNKLLNVLQISKDSVDECYELILEIARKASVSGGKMDKNRNFDCFEDFGCSSFFLACSSLFFGGSSFVTDECFSYDSLNESCVLDSSSSSSSVCSSSSSVCSSSPDQVFKRNRVQ